MRASIGVVVVAIASCGPPLADFPVAPTGPMEVPADVIDDDCGPYSSQTLALCIQQQRIEQDVRAIAKPRPPASRQHQAVRSLCHERLASQGYEVELHQYDTGVNVIGVKPGFSRPQEHVVVGAHYDHLPDCPGADDNASGVAVVLETARVLSEARFDRSLVVACWDEAERGQVGSTAYASRAKSRSEEIVVAINYESVGFFSDEPDSQRIPDGFEQLFPDEALALLDSSYRGDFLLVIGETSSTTWAESMQRHGVRNGLPVHLLRLSDRQRIKQQDKLHRSDHVSFWKNDYPALLITDSGGYRNPFRHCKGGPDAADGLSYGHAAKVAQVALAGAVAALELR